MIKVFVEAEGADTTKLCAIAFRAAKAYSRNQKVGV